MRGPFWMGTLVERLRSEKDGDVLRGHAVR